jgi:transposase
LNSERRPRKIYTREFKLNAIRLTTEGGVSVAQAARDLGLNENTLHSWRKQLSKDPQHAFPGKGYLKPLEEENRRLRRDNLKLQQENTFLKRAAVWLAREAHRSTE